MRILVYGAGVIGCTMAHMLIKAGHDVTLLARGDWKNTLERDGLVIHHYARFRTTKDRVKVIEHLAPEDEYDLIFVVMQYGQMHKVLLTVAENKSRFIVLVGNNLAARECSTMLPGKEVAFGFQSTGGRRENGKVISIYAKMLMTVGPVEGELSEEFKMRITKAFAKVKYDLTFEQHMDAWLKCHIAFILPIAYVCYANDCKLKRATKEQLDGIIDATVEAHQVLKALGYPLRPDGEEEYFTANRKKCVKFIGIMAKTPLGKLAASDHCEHAVAEMQEVDRDFCELCASAKIPMPAWNTLRAHGKPGETGRFKQNGI